MKRAAFLGCVLVGMGCGGASAGAGGSAVATQYAGPVQSDDIARGEELYAQACNGCHSGGPALENIGWRAGAMRQQIREGSSGMPPVSESRLPNEDMEAVLAYLVTIGGVQ